MCIRILLGPISCLSLRRKVQEGVCEDEPAHRLRSHGATGAQLGRHIANSYPAGEEAQPPSDI